MTTGCSARGVIAFPRSFHNCGKALWIGMAIASFEEAAERTWAHVVERAQQELSESSFSMWFGGVRPRSLHDGILEVVAPSDYVRERLAKHYAGLIQDAATEAVGLPVKLSLDSAPPEALAGQREAADPPASRPAADPRPDHERPPFGAP